MQFRRRAVVVWIAPGDDARPAGTAGARGQVGIGEAHTLGRQAIDMRSVNIWVAVTSEVIPTDVVPDDQHKVGPTGGARVQSDHQRAPPSEGQWKFADN